MKHHYWEPPIALYLFLGGLAGGILFLAAIFNSFVVPGYAEVFALPVLVSLVCVAIGCVFLVVDLGQPGVFWRVWTRRSWSSQPCSPCCSSWPSSATRGRCSPACRPS